MTDLPATATRETFQEHVSEGWVLVDFWSPRCRPCISLWPHVEALHGSHSGLRIVKIEAPRARRLCMDLKVMGLPTFLLFRDGQEVGRISDSDLDVDQLMRWLQDAKSGAG